jgi:DNA transposition AAA+ family ATPase
MKEKFVITKNVEKFQIAIQRINHKSIGLERIALIEGEVGLGKTEAALHYGAQNGAVMLSIWPRMTQHWLLSDITRELGFKPAWRTGTLIEKIQEELIKKPRTLIFDEIDHFFRDRDPKRIDALETLRKIHDLCHCPMIFIGEKGIAKKVRDLSRINDRIVEMVYFEKLEVEDVKSFISEISEYKFEAEAIEKITRDSNGRIRPIMNLLHAAEKHAKANQLKIITGKDLK